MDTRLIISLLAMQGALGAGATVFVDSATGKPLAKASVLDRNGTVAGICSDRGELPYISPDAYPVTIQYMGYEPVTLVRPREGTVKMIETPYDLAEVEFVARKPEVLQIQGYLREYSTLTTSAGDVMLFREKAVDFMVPSNEVKSFKGWLYPRVLSSRSYYHFTDSEGLDSVSNTFSQHFSWSDWVGIFKERELPDLLKNRTSVTDTVMGKYTPSQIWNRNGQRVALDIDMLARKENLSWAPRIASFIAEGNDFTRFTMKYQFDDVTAGNLSADNISLISYNIESSRSGRDMHRLSARETPLYVSTYAELYITDRRYISVADARRAEKNPPLDEFARLTAPDNAPALPPSTVNLIRRVDSIDHDSRRREAEADHRYIGKPNKERFSIIGSIKKVIKLVQSIAG